LTIQIVVKRDFLMMSVLHCIFQSHFLKINFYVIINCQKNKTRWGCYNPICSYT